MYTWSELKVIGHGRRLYGLLSALQSSREPSPVYNRQACLLVIAYGEYGSNQWIQAFPLNNA